MDSRALGVTGKLASWVVEMDYRGLPEEVIDRAKACLLDWIGSAYSGKGSFTERIMMKLIRERGGKRVSSFLGSGFWAPPVDAAFYNGTISAVMEVDDVHEESSLHTSIAVIPAALAMAEATGSSGPDMILAIVAGYDISGRISRAAGPSHYQYWHTTGTCNTFGAAATAGKMLHLDPGKMTMALGLAGTQAAGFWESLNAGATTAKHLHSGKAAANGIWAALLAKEGFRGSDRILEGERGFLAATSKATDQDVAILTTDLGKPFLIMRNFFKRHACCRACFEGIEGVGKILKDNHMGPQDVSRILVTMKPMRTWMVGNEDPRDIYEAKFSLPFAIGLMALRGGAGLYEFNEENLRDPSIRSWMKKIRIASDPRIAAKARIEMTDRNGRKFVEEPICHSLDTEGVKEKFARNMRPLLKEGHIRAILSSVENLHEIEDIGELTRLLKRRPQGG